MPLNIKEEQILVSKSARDEAYVASKFTLEAPTSLVLADSKISSLISSELAAKGRNTYLPEGRLLTNCEASKIALNWEDFRHTKDLLLAEFTRVTCFLQNTGWQKFYFSNRCPNGN